MKSLKVFNPFNAPVYHIDIVSSTMDISRQLALNGEPHGTVILADFQEEGRGRIKGRQWLCEEGKNLMFTVLLRFKNMENIPQALTLRAGLAVSLAIEDFLPDLKDTVKVKWPNDIIINDKKIAGILCEADGGNVHIGIGINVSQKEFPANLSGKAASISLVANKDIPPSDNSRLLEKILNRLFDEIKNNTFDWKYLLEKRFYKVNEIVAFIEGAADSGRVVKGRLTGIGNDGEILILPDGETQSRSFFNGELVIE
ncbi:MAG: biotin--[acetyl-CoA-carboxylase] ligase [Treponema sp.]|nr:biotin--[acetyl-CoA-carboxylase] ligase [Treponema sp.]